MKSCPECAEEIKLEAKVCRYCGTTFALTHVGYCIRCHKVVAQSELGVCSICGSRLLDVRLESLETAGPTIGLQGGMPVAASVPGFVPPAGPVEEIKDESATKPPTGVTTVWTPPAPTEPPAPGLPPETSPVPGPPPGVAWAKSGAPIEAPAPEPEIAATAAGPEPEPPGTAEPAVETTPDIVAERLAAFGRREPVVPTPPGPPAPTVGPPVPPPPGPPAPTVGPPVPPPPGPPIPPPARPPVTAPPRPPVTTPVRPPAATTPPVTQGPSAPTGAVGHPVTPVTVAPPVNLKPKPETAEAKPLEPTQAAGQRLGIVPSLGQRAAYPFYLLAVIVVLAMWLINFYWDGYLKGSSKPGSQTLSHFTVATYGQGGMILIGWQIGVIAIICALLMPTRLQPKGWFRQRGVAKEYAKELKAELAVDVIFTQKWFFQKLMLAFALWAIAIGALVATLVRKGSFVLETGGYVTIAALLVGFACSGVLAVRREPVVSVDDLGRIHH